MAAQKAKLRLKLNRKLSRLDIFLAFGKFRTHFRSHYSLPIKHWDCVHRLPFYFVANILLLILFSGTLFYVVHIFDTHLITFSNDFHVACHRVSLDDCKKISLLLLLLLLVFVALLKSASIVHWSRKSSIVARPLHLRDRYIKKSTWWM